jgi:hypothetical protein
VGAEANVQQESVNEFECGEVLSWGGYSGTLSPELKAAAQVPGTKLSGIIAEPSGSVGPDAKVSVKSRSMETQTNSPSPRGGGVATSQNAIQGNSMSATLRGALI